MANRLWFLAQLTSRFAINSLARHTSEPSFIHSYSVRRFLCADHKPDILKSNGLSSHVDAEVQQGSSEGVSSSSKASLTFKSDISVIANLKRTRFMKRNPDKLIWEGYRIRYRSGHPPKKTRKQCKRNSKKAISGSPCPICANDIDITHQDIPLLKQFICPFTGKVIEPVKTGVCRSQQKKLMAAIEKARDIGLLPFTIQRPDIRQ